KNRRSGELHDFTRSGIYAAGPGLIRSRAKPAKNAKLTRMFSYLCALGVLCARYGFHFTLSTPYRLESTLILCKPYPTLKNLSQVPLKKLFCAGRNQLRPGIEAN